MYVQTLKTLCQRRVAVLRDGLTVGTRLGFSYLAEATPAIPVSLRPGFRSVVPMPEPDVDNSSDQDESTGERAGRSARIAGVPACRIPPAGGTGRLVRAARLAGRSALAGKTVPAAFTGREAHRPWQTRAWAKPAISAPTAGQGS